MEGHGRIGRKVESDATLANGSTEARLDYQTAPTTASHRARAVFFCLDF